MASTPSDEEAAAAAAPPGARGGTIGPLLRLFRDQRIAFLAVGGANTVIGFLWFALFQATVGQILGYMATLVCAHVASVLCAFVLYRNLVFRVRGHVIRDLLRFESVYLVAIGVNAVLLPVLVEFVHLPVLVAQASILLVTTLVSFFGHRYFSFRRTAAQTAATAPPGSVAAGAQGRVAGRRSPGDADRGPGSRPAPDESADTSSRE